MNRFWIGLIVGVVVGPVLWFIAFSVVTMLFFDGRGI